MDHNEVRANNISLPNQMKNFFRVHFPLLSPSTPSTPSTTFTAAAATATDSSLAQTTLWKVNIVAGFEQKFFESLDDSSSWCS